MEGCTDVIPLLIVKCLRSCGLGMFFSWYKYRWIISGFQIDNSSNHHSSIVLLIKLPNQHSTGTTIFIFCIFFSSQDQHFQRWSLLIGVSALPNSNINSILNIKMDTKKMNKQSKKAQKDAAGNSSDKHAQNKSMSLGLDTEEPKVLAPTRKEERISKGQKKRNGKKKMDVQQGEKVVMKNKRVLKTDGIDAPEPKMKRARVGSNGTKAKRVRVPVRMKSSATRPLVLPVLRSKPTPVTTGKLVTPLEVVKEGTKKRGFPHAEKRDRKRVKTADEASGAVERSTEGKKGGEKNDWLSFLGDGDRLVAEMESLERKKTKSGSSGVQIRTAKEAMEAKERYESLYRVCRAGVGWMDDLAMQMRVLEWKRMAATEEEKKRVAERVSWKKEMSKEKHEKVSRIVEKMRERVKEVRNALKAWERTKSKDEVSE